MNLFIIIPLLLISGKTLLNFNTMSSLMEYITARFQGQWWVHCWSDLGFSSSEIPSVLFPISWARGVVGTFESWWLDTEPHWGCVLCVKGPQPGITCHPSEETSAKCGPPAPPAPPCPDQGALLQHLSLPLSPCLSSQPKEIASPYLSQDRAVFKINFAQKQRGKPNTQGENAAA